MPEFDPGSFKDPAGRVFYDGDAVFRTISAEAKSNFVSAKAIGLIAILEREGLIVDSTLVQASDVGLNPGVVGDSVLHQRRVPLVSYSYEWSTSMLRDAALTTLRIQDCALRAGFTLKDGTAFNVLFDRLRPMLVDVPSLEPHHDGDIWVGYSQFCRSLLFPLLIATYRGLDVRPLLRGWLGEVPASEAATFFSWRDALKPAILKDVLVQARLDQSFAVSQSQVRRATNGLRVPRSVLLANIRRLTKVVETLPTQKLTGTWADYESTNSYSDVDREIKVAFVREVTARGRFNRVVDLGCNTGQYSRVALENVPHVVSIDLDPVCIDRLYRSAPPGASISVLVADLLNPTPAMGWGLVERASLLARLHCDGFLALGLLHHLRIAGGVPLDRILDALFHIADEGIIEWVDKEDSMVRRMLMLRADIYSDYTWTIFEQLITTRAQLIAVQATHGGARRLCHVRARRT